MKAIVITGPESSGKSSLGNYLKITYDLPLVPEYSRMYLDHFGPRYVYDDLVKIAQGQISLEKEYLNKNTRTILMDTDLITILIWSKHKFGKCDPFIVNEVAKIKDRHYLLCKPDIPWVYDQYRENPEDRAELFEVYKSTLNELKLEHSIISGDNKNRFKTAANILDSLKAN